MDHSLYEAAMKGDMKPFEKLVLSSLLEKKTRNQETVLHIATEFHRMELARFVVHHCPQLLLLQNSLGDTALHIAAREGDRDMVDFFLSHPPLNDSEAGISNSQTRKLNNKNDAALHCAARSGGSKCVELLVKKDSEVRTYLNNAKESPLYLSIVSRLYIMPEIILNPASSNLQYHKGKNGLTELHAAVLKQKYPIESIKKLVEWKKEMIKEGDDLGMTPLHYAAFHGRYREVELFVEKDPSAIYCVNKNGQSALYVAAFNGQLNVFKELVKCRPDCDNIVDNEGRTALHAAVLGEQREVVEFVLRTPSLARLIHMVDNDGNTPLHLAANYKFFKIIKSFRRNVRAYFALNHDSFTPFDVYQQHIYEQDMERLEVDEDPEISAAPYPLYLAKGVVAEGQFANEKQKMANLERWRVEEKITNEREKQKEITKRNRMEERRNEESALEVNLLVAMLVATVTFAAGFTVPGGLVNDGANEGLATLANKPTFQAFVVFNTLAFSCSILAVLIHFDTSLSQRATRIKYKDVAACLTALGIVAMVLAFCFGTSIVLTKSTALSLLPYCIPPSFLLLYPFRRQLNRRLLMGRRQRRYWNDQPVEFDQY